jgi:serine/threonine-protein kinase
MALEPGARLGPYEVVSPLGAGGMGEVYRARHLKLGRDVAIKVLPEELASDPERRQRFEREARAASALNHPNVVTIHDIDERGGIHYIAMELVKGRTLRELLDQGPLPLGRLLALARQVATGLARAHAAGIVHRDLKPENVMVTDDGLVKILDFGLAKLAPEATEAGSQVSTVEQATRAGVVLGTVPYMSPEQAAGRRVDLRSDQFSFGSILYEMATGRRAFRKDTSPQTLAAIIEGEPVPARRLNPALPESLVALVERCLAKDPEGRFVSTRELAAALEAVSETPPTSRLRRRAFWALAAATAAALAWVLPPHIARLWPLPGSGAAPAIMQSVAVLPLQNLSGDPEQDYLAEGMTEALITHLAKVGALKVISRSSTMRYDRGETPVSEIARELGVDAVVEGSAARVGDRVRIMAQLIDPRTGRALWGNSYERAFSDVLRLQGEVAQAIAGEIGAAVTPEERERLTTQKAAVPEALEAYLKGEVHLSRFTPQDLQTALRYFQTALEVDPDYAPAQAGIAMVWSSLIQANVRPPREVGPRALAAASRAVELDGRSSPAHGALGVVRTWYQWDWEGAEAEFQRAIELKPSSAPAHMTYAHLLAQLKRFDESARHMERSLELDPLNPMAQAMSGIQLMMAGQLDEAIARLRATLKRSPGFGLGHVPLWAMLDRKGRYEEALVSLKNHHAITEADPEMVDVLEAGYAAGGYREALRRVAQTLEDRSKNTYVGAIHVVDLFDKVGDREKALEWLERAYEARDPSMAALAVIPLSEELKQAPLYKEMLERLDLPRG